MSKKLALGLVLTMMVSMTSAFAHSTIYTDEIGRHHFLGKDPGSLSAQNASKYANHNDNAQKDVTDVIYKNQDLEKFNNKKFGETPVSSSTATQDALEGYFNYNKNNVPVSDFKMPVGRSGVNESKTIYTDDIGRMHFFTKDSKVKY